MNKSPNFLRMFHMKCIIRILIMNSKRRIRGRFSFRAFKAIKRKKETPSSLTSHACSLSHVFSSSNSLSILINSFYKLLFSAQSNTFFFFQRTIIFQSHNRICISRRFCFLNVAGYRYIFASYDYSVLIRTLFCSLEYSTESDETINEFAHSLVNYCDINSICIAITGCFIYFKFISKTTFHQMHFGIACLITFHHSMSKKYVMISFNISITNCFCLLT